MTLSYTVGLSAGSAGTIASRQMVGPNPGTPLGYNLYTTNARATVWGTSNFSDGYSALATVGGTVVPRNYTVYGRIPAGQYVAPGSYGSTITVTVTY
ncbi:Spore Coat Protein U domain protein [compost metagenome]